MDLLKLDKFGEVENTKSHVEGEMNMVKVLVAPQFNSISRMIPIIISRVMLKCANYGKAFLLNDKPRIGALRDVWGWGHFQI